MHALPDGFELTFTAPVDPKTAGDPKSYSMRTHTYIYQADYGSPEVDETKPTIDKAAVSDDGKTVRLTVETLVEGHVHELHLDGVRSSDGAPAAARGGVLHDERRAGAVSAGRPAVRARGAACS